MILDLREDKYRKEEKYNAGLEGDDIFFLGLYETQDQVARRESGEDGSEADEFAAPAWRNVGRIRLRGR